MASKKTQQAKPASAPVTLVLDRERALVLDFNALIKIEETLGVSTLQPTFWQEFLKNMTAAKLRVVLWAGLLRDDATLTLDQVGAMLSPANFADAIRAVVKAQVASTPERDERPTGAADAAESR